MLSTINSLLLIGVFFTSCVLANYGYLYLEDKDKDVDQVEWMNRTMGTIFIVLGVLKLTNLKGFAKIFSKYDVLSQRFRYYGYVYPFLEILLGFSFFIKEYRETTYKATIALMSVSLLGVGMNISQGTSLRCGCLGAFFHVPLSYVTISENLVMIAMSAYLLNKSN